MAMGMRIAAAMGLFASLALFGAGPALGETTYQYDVHGRLVQVARPAKGEEIAYTYDDAHNRTALTSRVAFSVMQGWEAEESPYHLIGAATVEGWAAPATAPADALNYGPYATNVPVGANVGVWRLMIGNEAVSPSQQILRLDVFDTTANQVVAQRVLRRSDWKSSYSYEYFTLPFDWASSRQGHAIELRAFYTPSVPLREDRIGLAAGVLRGPQAGAATTSWEAESALYHLTGFQDGDGWAANTASAAGALTYGPYVVPAVGQRVALWTLMVGDVLAAEDESVRLEIFDSTQGDVVTFRSLTPQAFSKAMTYETFGIPFTVDASRSGHTFEFRTFFRPRTYVRIDKIGVR